MWPIYLQGFSTTKGLLLSVQSVEEEEFLNQLTDKDNDKEKLVLF